MVATYYGPTDASVAETGTWSTIANTAYIGGSARQSTVAGDLITITTPPCRSLYISSAKANTGADLKITVDGVQSGHVESCYWQSNAPAIKTPMPIFRNLPEKAHTVVIQSQNTGGGGSSFYNNGYWAISGPKITKGSGVYSAVGDSWGTATGVAGALNGYVGLNHRYLCQALGRELALSNRSVSGAGCANRSSSTAPNMIEQLVSAQNDGFEFLTVQFGVNDLYTGNGAIQLSPALYAQLYRTGLLFIQDLFDVLGSNPATISVATPGWISPFFKWAYDSNAGTNLTVYSSGASAYELGVIAARRVIRQFSWAKMADVYRAMNRRNDLVFPNATGDYGLHPNIAGHEIVAETHFNALLSGVVA